MSKKTFQQIRDSTDRGNTTKFRFRSIDYDYSKDSAGKETISYKSPDQARNDQEGYLKTVEHEINADGTIQEGKTHLFRNVGTQYEYESVYLTESSPIPGIKPDTLLTIISAGGKSKSRRQKRRKHTNKRGKSRRRRYLTFLL